MRLSRLRYRSDTFASETLEEAPISMDAWMVQRTRWIKGWMQTFIVHNRRVGEFLRDIGWRNFLFFEIYGGPHSLVAAARCSSRACRARPSGHWPRVDSAVTPPSRGQMSAASDGVLILGSTRGGRGAAASNSSRSTDAALVRVACRAPVDVPSYFWGRRAHGGRARRRTRCDPGAVAASERSAVSSRADGRR